jgi:hypothetical protein
MTASYLVRAPKKWLSGRSAVLQTKLSPFTLFISPPTPPRVRPAPRTPPLHIDPIAFGDTQATQLPAFNTQTMAGASVSRRSKERRRVRPCVY